MLPADDPFTRDDVVWVPVSPTLKSMNGNLSWCLPLPSPYRFFRLVEGLSPRSAGSSLTVSNAASSSTRMELQWTAPLNQRFAIEWTQSLFPPYWQPYPAYVTSTNTTYTFIDDGSLTGGLGTNRYYRIFLVP